MRLIPWEEERLAIFAAAELARRRRAAGLRLNHPEAVALIADAMLEAARAGAGYAEVEEAGRAAVEPGEVLDGVRELLDEVRVEVLFGDGARVIALVDPLDRGTPPDPLGPGALVIGDPSDVVVNEGRAAIELEVTSRSRAGSGSRRTSRSSGSTRASRSTATPPAGFHLDLAGRRVRRLGAGRDEDRRASSARRRRRHATARPRDPPLRGGVPRPVRRRRPATGSGSATPTCGSASARTAPPRGDEPVWGYAKNLRSRMAQWDDGGRPSELDVVLTGALVVDPVIGVVKADIGIKDGRIAGIGRAGSPAISDGIDLVVGPHTKSYMAYGLIATPGAVDTHVHTIDPELLAPALSAGVTTLDHRGLRGAAVRDGAVARRARGVADQHRHAGGRAGDRRGPPRRAGRGRRRRVQDPRGQRRVPGAHRPRCCATPTRAT